MTRIRTAHRGVVDLVRLVRLACLVLFLVAACAQDPAPRPAATAPTPTASAKAKRARPRPRPLQLTRVTIKALGMTCEESCPIKVRTALAAVPAVYELGFDLPTESIFVSYDATLGAPKAVTRPMLDAIRSAGFDPWLAKDSWPETATAAPL